MLSKIGLGGGCHWCTEAVFLSLHGVERVDQGWISAGDNSAFSEAIVVEFDADVIDLATIIEVHLLTHSSGSAHSMREKYRSAVYAYSDFQVELVTNILEEIRSSEHTKKGIGSVTQVLPMSEFKLNDEQYLNYYYSNPQKPFCKTYIDRKLALLLDRFASFANREVIQQAIN